MSSIELDTEPPPYEQARIIREKIQVLREQTVWDSPTQVQLLVTNLCQVVEQILGQYHQDNKPQSVQPKEPLAET